jgi:hypothetical protein
MFVLAFATSDTIPVWLGSWWQRLIYDPINVITFIIAVFTIGLYFVGRDTARRELRAYIGVKDHTIRTIEDSGGFLRFQAVITVENGGQTPALNVRRALDVGIGDENRSDFRIDGLTGRMPMIPHSLWEMRQVFWNLSEEDIRHITNSHRHAFVWGRVEYEDIYGETRHLNFRFITREIITTNGAVSGWALHPTEDGNETT